MRRKTDFYEWIRSLEIREFLREHHPLSLMEKAEIVCGAFRSVEEKYAALEELLPEAEKETDREALIQLIRLYQWAFGELEENRPGQIFTCGYKHPSDEIGHLETRDYIDDLFCSYEEVRMFLRAVEQNWKNMEDGDGFWVGKSVPVNGEMKEVLGLDFYFVDGVLKLVMFWPADHMDFDIYKELKLGYEARSLHEWRNRDNDLPIPFQSGDLVRLDPPVLGEPAYGVLYMYDNPGDRRYMWLYYLQDGMLEDCSMSYQSIGMTSPWRVIDWMHPADSSGLPPGQEILAELSQAFHKAGHNSAQGEKIFSQLVHLLPVPVERRIPLTLSEALSGRILRKENI